MKKTYCDRCGDEMIDDYTSYPKLMFKYQHSSDNDEYSTHIAYKDLCYKCKSSIIKFIKTGCKE